MKKIKGLLVIFLSLFILAGCAPGKKSEKNGVVEIDFWHFWGSEQRKPTIEAMIKEFNDKNPNIKVKATFVPWDDIFTKSLAAVSAGNPPDVVVQDVLSVGVRASRNQVTDISQFVDEDVKKRFIPQLWDAVQHDGKTYGLPFNTDTRLLFYNKKLFKEAGLEEAPKTWKELEEYAEKLDKKEDGKVNTYGFYPLWGNMGFSSWVYSNDGGFYDNPSKPAQATINSENNLETLEWILKWRDKYGAQNINAANSSFGSGANDPFISGKVAMYSTIANYTSTLKKYAPDMEYGIAPMPVGPSGKEPNVFGGGFALEIPKGSKHPKEAYEFIKFMTDKWASTKWAEEQKDIMANSEANNEPKLMEDSNWKAIIDNMQHTIIPIAYSKAPDAGNVINTAVDMAVTAKKDAKKALDDAQNQVEEMIKSTK